MDRVPISSSHIVSIGYDESSLTLEVEFLHNAVYLYFDVPPAVYSELMQAESKGTYLAANVKNVYRYVKV